ncbi:hypothetical protein Desor_1693 [Desulfosporosinus orientis DSM 765]|uniref:Uncharacterized protein n=1 Tax=Desulfosporosinus orientis (strain ATCC 19365 / DSM 765 / NCIMB 8382 / VKM B-1628 / Singapore I) TaxID=768706 RepID=G7W5V7_DESOD|nr:hypothetical protein [Desulfosporosinus orientis]AET67333.1 hypothetical protein Desor_1693 [Desulfosporosinus orientis DSM 765]
MKTERAETSATQNEMASIEFWSKVLVGDVEQSTAGCSPSVFGPCCSNGCQYCRPNCHEKFDSSNYF